MPILWQILRKRRTIKTIYNKRKVVCSISSRSAAFWHFLMRLFLFVYHAQQTAERPHA